MESYYPYIKPNYFTKKNETPVYIRFNYDRKKRTLIPVNITINPDHFDSKKRKLKLACPDYAEYELKIRNKINKISAIIENARIDQIDPTIDYVISELKNETDYKSKNGNNFFEILDAFIETSKGRVVPDVIKDYNSLKKHLKGFSDHSRQEISFKSFNYIFYQQFISYLTYDAEKPNEEKGLATNTVGKQIKNLKVFLKDCMRKKYCKTIDLKDFKTISEEVDKIYLTVDELKRIEELDLSDNEEMDLIRDYLLIGCLTGLRFSDFSAIESHHIKGKYLHKKISKTHSSQVIPLKNKVIEILHKHNNDLPKIDSYRFNKLVKTIGETAKINEDIELVYKRGAEKVKTVHKKYNLISSHTCRRSFCTNEFLAGTPIIYIMKISGHKTQKSFMRYIRIDEEEAAKKMLEIWEKSNN